MAYNKAKNQDVYGLSQAIINEVTQPIVSTRNPATTDKAPIGSVWINKSTHGAWILAGVSSNTAYWSTAASTVGGDLNVTGAATIGTGLTVSAGGITSTGSISNTGAILATTSIGAGTTLAAGTSVTAGTTITATLGNITATNGNFVAATAGTGFYLGAAGPRILCGTGDPAASVPKGSLYIKTDASTTTDRLWIATDAAGTWTYFTSNA